MPLPPEDRKKTRFFVFTDWRPPKNQTATGLDHWIPFNAPGQSTELCEIKKQVNATIDSRLAGYVLDDNRVYFTHLNRGVELIEEEGAPDWKYMQGVIVESEAISSQRGHADALARLADGLATNAPSYLRSKLKVLVCLLPAPGLPAHEKFKPEATFRIKQTLSTQELIDRVSDWLTEANQQIDDDRKGYDAAIVDQVDELLNKYLG